MKCEICAVKLAVVKTTHVGNIVIRLRKCPTCGRVVKTAESQ